jgi:hypothetical protein
VLRDRGFSGSFAGACCAARGLTGEPIRREREPQRFGNRRSPRLFGSRPLRAARAKLAESRRQSAQPELVSAETDRS